MKILSQPIENHYGRCEHCMTEVMVTEYEFRKTNKGKCIQCPNCNHNIFVEKITPISANELPFGDIMIFRIEKEIFNIYKTHYGYSIERGDKADNYFTSARDMNSVKAIMAKYELETREK